MKVLGVRLDNVTVDEALARIKVFFDEGQHTIFTPNPEMLVDAQKDEYFKEVLNESDLNIADGKGIEYMTFFKQKRIAGTDFVYDICRLAEQESKSVFLLGSGNDDVLKKAKETLLEKHPNLKIAGMHSGIVISSKEKHDRILLDVDAAENNEMIAEIALAAPDILFVAFGHKKQEKWMYEYLEDLPSVKVAMGVGGALDYISGNIKRAPKWMRAIGLEWLFRLFVQPQRIGRILKATVVFPLYMLFKR